MVPDIHAKFHNQQFIMRRAIWRHVFGHTYSHTHSLTPTAGVQLVGHTSISLPSIAIIPFEPAIRHCSEIVVPALILPYNSISVMVLPRVVSAPENIVLVHFPKYVRNECVCVHVCVNTIIFGFKTVLHMLHGLSYSVLYGYISPFHSGHGRPEGQLSLFVYLHVAK